MSLIKYIERLKRMDEFIRKRATGTPAEFARKMGICKSMLMFNIAELREMGAPIKYNAILQSYYYYKPCEMKFGFELEESELSKIIGGNLFMQDLESNDIRSEKVMFVV